MKCVMIDRTRELWLLDPREQRELFELENPPRFSLASMAMIICVLLVAAGALGFRLATSRAPKETELAELGALLERLRAHYAADQDAARALLEVGDRPLETRHAPSELAAWTLLASTLLNLDEVIVRG